ncbi:MAG: plasmid partition protein ParG [Desulfobulbus sp.]|nr:plasmid partition protein ParG [Desulfobulbus sp.]
MVAENKTAVADKVTDKAAEVTKEEKKGTPETPDTQVKLKSINIKLPEEVHRKLKSKAALDGESTSKVVTRLIDEYVKAV